MALSQTEEIGTGPVRQKADGTYDAAHPEFGSTSDSDETRIQNAINQAAADAGVDKVFVPDSLLPYDASSVTFDDSVRMVREGQQTNAFDPAAYGAAGDDPGDGTGTDDTAALKAAVSGAINKQGRVLLNPEDAYRITDQITIGAPVTFGGPGMAAGRWNQDDVEDGAATIVADGLGTTPAVVIGGTDDSPFSGNLLEAVKLTPFMLISATAGGGDTGIILDGSTTRDADRGPLRDVELHGVKVRGFGTRQLQVLGNVFDVRHFNCAYDGRSGNAHGVQYTTANSVAASDDASQMHYYGSVFRSGAGNWGIDSPSSSDSHIYGGIDAGNGNGIKLGDGSSLQGLHMEGGDETTGIGVLILRNGVRGHMMTNSGYDTAFQVGEDGSSKQATKYRIFCRNIDAGSVGVRVEQGGARRGVIEWGKNNAPTAVDDQRGGEEFGEKYLTFRRSTSGYYFGDDWLVMGGAFTERKKRYDDGASETQEESRDSGGSFRSRLTIPDRADRELWQFSNAQIEEQDFSRANLGGDLSLGANDARYQNLDPNGAARNVDLPAEAAGKQFWIACRGGAANDITVRDDSGSTLVTLNPGDMAICHSDGTGWMVVESAGAVT